MLADPRWAETYVRFELLLLQELGFALDLASCAVTGATDDLAYVSPRTGRAVARGAAGDLAARLLPLPPFLVADVPATEADLRAGLRLSGHFLARQALAPADKTLARRPRAAASAAPATRRDDRMSRATAEILPIPLKDALSERYLAYALSTITARSLPDVRDGLKPVQRRILYAMLQLRLDPAGGFKKCARVVGDVIGKFHPHGDVAVYDALVRLAQDFAQRYPLVDGQGNFGNIDGDNPAAMRYTESRLTAVAMALLEGIDEDAVDFRDNYDGSDSEPVVLPAAFPNLLANGAAGIAVGMATSIPPHNAGELLSALAWMAGRPAGARPPDGRGAAAPRPRARPAHRRLLGRAGGRHRRGLPHRPRQLPPARALGEGGAGLRPVPGGRHRDPLSGARKAA